MAKSNPPGKSAAHPDQEAHSHIPIVGIGASAGGLEALEELLQHMPVDSGLAFVVIQHLDPDHHDIMPELLQRSTTMPVAHAGDGMRLEADHVYIIPPNKYLSLLDGVLYLLEPTEPRGRRLPIDYFFRALADERHERAIGVILSGMGSDGTLGLRAIKEHAGLAVVQEPETAKFDAMPRSVITAGLADIVAPAKELPEKIIAYAHHLSPEGRPLIPAAESSASRNSLEKIFILLRSHTGHDFSLYKKSTVYRRIDRRMGIHQINRIADYVRYLNENPQELQLLFKELLIGVTNFFRDPEAWATLQERVLPELLANAPAAGKSMRAWVAGCSTGEEAFSLAMAFKETLDLLKPRGRFSLQIFATDLDPDAIEKARQGLYPSNITADVSPERLARFFVEEGNGYRVSKEIREMVVFAPQNVIMDPPFTKLDILCCRNLLIYLGAELQRKLLPLFHYSLIPGGALFLGSAETIGSFTDLFTPLEGKARLFKRIGGPSLAVDFPSRHHPAPAHPPEEPKEIAAPVNLQALADRVLLQHFSPAAVLVNTEGDLVYINGRTGKYLEPAAGKANWNIYAMAR
ncbi:MAG: chemotaxis protein CheB, partial [Actinomycetota bacterium]